MAAVARFGLDSPVLSLAIPLTVVAVRARRERRERRQNFFRELLPEGRRSWGLAGAAGLAEETLVLVRQLASSEAPHPRASARLAQDIAGFAGNLLAGRAIGASRRQP